MNSAFHLVVEAPQRLACTNASDNYLIVPYSSPKVKKQSLPSPADPDLPLEQQKKRSPYIVAKVLDAGLLHCPGLMHACTCAF